MKKFSSWRKLRKDAREKREASSEDILAFIEELKPYLGEPDDFIDGEPAWSGERYKLAYRDYLKDTNKAEYEEYLKLLAESEQSDSNS